MSGSPECIKCGDYVHHGPVICSKHFPPTEAQVERAAKAMCYYDGPRVTWAESSSRLAGRLAAAREALERIRNVGHNDDCMFCGFKDKEVRAVLDKEVGE